ncbi:MAG: glycosyltransferase [Gammaproteobacteria bacterium]|nr:glycosyltransferase [Gammaproteobacteria bacterium]
MKKTVLFISGFVADTYSEIEASFVELCQKPDAAIQYLWLVPTMSFGATRVSHADSKRCLSEPVYVPRLREAGIPYIVGDIHKTNIIANFLLFRRLFKQHRIDALYMHFGFERFWAAFFGKLWGKTTIWNAHWHSLGTRFIFIKRFFYLLFIDYFISVSGFITRTLPKKNRIYTIANSIRAHAESSSEDERRQTSRRQLGLPATGKVVLMVAAFTRQKRHALALEICREVVRRNAEITFVFLGDGSERASIAGQIHEAGLDKHFVMPGYVTNVDDYYAAADLCIFTALNDAAPYAVLEAMKHGLPVIAFATGGPAEVIDDGKAGALIREGDTPAFLSTLTELLSNDARRREMGRYAARLIREKYSRDAWIAQVNAALKEIVGER